MLGPLRSALAAMRERRRIRRTVRARLRARQPVRVVVGAGGTEAEGWIATDLPVLDALRADHWKSLFPARSIDRVLAEHVAEHWTGDELAAFCAAVGPRLAPDGFVRLAVPDGNHPDPAYREAVRPGGSGAGADDHKVLYTAASLREALHRAGFAGDVVECFTEGGTFQRSEWDAADGLVRRSAGFDPRNAGEPLAYTSLIVDCRPRGDRWREPLAASTP